MNNTDGKKIAIITLGCDKNRCDSEQLAGTLKTQGFILVASDKDADIIIVNTCAFIGKARSETLQVINSELKYKTRAASRGKIIKVIVTGCITAKHKALIPAEVDEIWALPDFADSYKLLSTPQSYAYIKIAEGCDNWCSYCTIPAIRGGYKSRPKKDILAEVSRFAALGVPEFILVAQDLTKYESGGANLAGLIREISGIPGVERIRLHYMYPDGVTDELIHEIAVNPKVCKYIDMPLQHVSTRILSLMNRHGGANEYMALINKLRSIVPTITIRSTFMVGFPTETAEDFRELCDFLTSVKLDYVGFFAYSREPFTRAYSMVQIAEKTKSIRLRTAERVQNAVLMQKNRELVGATLKVVCDSYDDVLGCSVTRSEYQSPEVDPYIAIYKCLSVGKFYRIKVTGFKDENLTGETVK